MQVPDHIMQTKGRQRRNCGALQKKSYANEYVTTRERIKIKIIMIKPSNNNNMEWMRSEQASLENTEYQKKCCAFSSERPVDFVGRDGEQAGFKELFEVLAFAVDEEDSHNILLTIEIALISGVCFCSSRLDLMVQRDRVEGELDYRMQGNSLLR